MFHTRGAPEAPHAQHGEYRDEQRLHHRAQALNNAMLNAGHSPELLTLRSSLDHNWDRSYNQTQWDFFMASAPEVEPDLVPVPA